MSVPLRPTFGLGDDPVNAFTLDVTILGSDCLGLNLFDLSPDTSNVPAANIESLILLDSNRIVGDIGDIAALQASLASLAWRTTDSSLS